MKHQTLVRLLLIALAFAAGPVVAKPIPIEDFARVPAIGSVSMSADGKQLVAIVAAPGSDYQDTALATWDVEDLKAGPVVTPSGKRMKFIAASALKAGKVLVAGRQEWTGELGGCGEGSIVGATATFVFKTYLTDVKHKHFEEAFAKGSGRRLGVSRQTRRCLDIAGSARLVSTLPLDPTHVIIQRAT
ncbi:MAG: S9 family peptidase, partial [Lysobacterales bacterium]